MDSLKNINLNYHEIEAIIFDLGGVIIDVNMNYPYNFFSQHSSLSADLLVPNLKQVAFAYEVGKINDDEFINNMQNILDVKYSKAEIINIWNGMLGYVPQRLGALLAQIKQDKKTFILSNTNPIHIAEVEQRFAQSITNYSFSSLFDKIYYSYEIGLHKPDLAIFEYVIKDQRLKPSTTLFIDDNLANVEGARHCGLKAIHMNPPMSLPDLFRGQILP
ncbi:MAG: HAD family phosphatase [Cyanobacterium sp. T60_A2020_053]|nr:HAD family phosphatase [Cyanobacterium sp. T60_A2020_053]